MRLTRLLAIIAPAAALYLLWRHADDMRILWQSLMFDIQHWQGEFRRTMTARLQTLRSAPESGLWWPLLSAAFLYGVLHAAGPGHGKAVISTFLLSRGGSYRQAAMLAAGTAFLQGLSALLWVGATFALLQWLLRDALAQAVWLERASHALVIVAGLYLTREGLRRDKHCCAHHHGGHGYGITLLAVSLRPCSGSLIALAVAGAWGMWGAGIAMTLAASAGTALTVLALAWLTVYGRNRAAQRFAAAQENSRAWRRKTAVLGGILLIALGGVLLAGSFAVTGEGFLLPK